jgi:hypothetical protein
LTSGSEPQPLRLDLICLAEFFLEPLHLLRGAR